MVEAPERDRHEQDDLPGDAHLAAEALEQARIEGRGFGPARRGRRSHHRAGGEVGAAMRAEAALDRNVDAACRAPREVA
jgi:hypothetical protein